MKFTAKPQTDGIYLVSDSSTQLGTVAKVYQGSTPMWGAYGPGEAISGPRWGFGTRKEAAAALVEFAATGNIRVLVP